MSATDCTFLDGHNRNFKINSKSVLFAHLQNGVFQWTELYIHVSEL